MVECDLLQIESLDSESRNKKRYGRYHGSCFWDIKKFGSKFHLLSRFHHGGP